MTKTFVSRLILNVCSCSASSQPARLEATCTQDYLFPYKLRRWLISAALAFYCLPSMAEQTPTPFEAEYKVTKGIMSVGTTKRRLVDQGNGSYLFESITKASGVAKLFTSGTVVERSHWHWSDNKFVPLEYEYHNSGAQKRDVKLKFDWVTMQVTNIINGEPWTMKIAENTLDKLVYQLAIMYDLSEGEESLLYQVADGGKTKTYDIKITKEEKVAIEFGKFNTTKIVRTLNDRKITMWCAKELRYLPVKIERRTKGDTPIVAELVDLSGIEYSPHIAPPAKKKQVTNTAPQVPTESSPATPPGTVSEPRSTTTTTPAVTTQPLTSPSITTPSAATPAAPAKPSTHAEPIPPAVEPAPQTAPIVQTPATEQQQ